MRRISFALTKPQLLDGSKTVTRRLGWDWLTRAPAEDLIELLAVSKCMGLRPGERADVYGVVEVHNAWRERLDAITQDDVRREGFPDWTPEQFVAFFIKANPKCRDGRTRKLVPTTPATLVTRIEFRFESTKEPK